MKRVTDKQPSTKIKNISTLSSTSHCELSPIRAYAVSPSLRSEHAVCLCGDYVYLYGGRTRTQFFTDFWKFNVRRNFWSPVKLSGNQKKLPPLRGHSMVNYNGKLYIFGGEILFAHYKEAPLWKFDLAATECEWEKVSSTKGLIGRYEHVAVTYNGKMWVHGGFIDLRGATNELWSYDFLSNEWLLYDKAMTGDCPSARHKHSGVVFRDSMIICGGLKQEKEKGNGNFWSWNFLDNSWNKIRTSGAPSQLYNHSACVAGNEMYVYGGNTKSNKPNKKMWKVSLAKNFWDHSHNWKSCTFQCPSKTVLELSETCRIIRLDHSIASQYDVSDNKKSCLQIQSKNSSTSCNSFRVDSDVQAKKWINRQTFNNDFPNNYLLRHTNSKQPEKRIKQAIQQPKKDILDLTESKCKYKSSQESTFLSNCAKEENYYLNYFQSTDEKSSLIKVCKDSLNIEEKVEKDAFTTNANEIQTSFANDSDLNSLLLNAKVNKPIKKKYSDMTNLHVTKLKNKAKSWMTTSRRQAIQDHNQSQVNSAHCGNYKTSARVTLPEGKLPVQQPSKLSHDSSLHEAFLINSSILKEIDNEVLEDCLENIDLSCLTFNTSFLIIGSKPDYVQSWQSPKPCTRVWKCEFKQKNV